VLAADLLAIAYIHRAKVKSRLFANPVSPADPLDPSLAPCPAM
jgi:hypothetical protein